MTRLKEEKYSENRQIWWEIKENTPGAANRLHFDNCGASLMSEAVVAAVTTHLNLDAQLGGYVAQERENISIAKTYGLLAAIFGGAAEDYALLSSAVDSWSRAFYSQMWQEGDNLVTAFNEYCANYVAYLHLQQTLGVEIRVARSLPEGGLDLDHLESLLDDRTRLISISHMSPCSGIVLDATAIGRLARAYDCLYLLDACQSVGQIPVNVQDIGCDMLSGTSRKFLRGPRGVGFLYMNERARRAMTPVIMTNQSASWGSSDGVEWRSDTAVFEAWERPVALQLGFRQALEDYALLGQNIVAARLRSRADLIRAKIDQSSVLQACCPSNAVGAIITCQHSHMPPDRVKDRLDQQNIGVQVATAYHSRLDMEARGLDAVIRLSPHVFSLDEDIDLLFHTMEALR